MHPQVTDMLILINSAKTQKVNPRPELPITQPQLKDLVANLAGRCKKLQKKEIISVMKVSEKLAETTWQRFQQFSFPHHETTSGPALTAFAGDIYKEIDTDHYRQDDFLFAQGRLRILSGLYGILRPLDLIQPYRLEMGYKIAIGSIANLYDYWSESITDVLNRDLEENGSSIILNCASKEYSRCILNKKLNGSLLNLSFRQKKNGTTRSIAIYSKWARGMFVDWFITNRVSRPEQLKGFDRGGYRFAETLSSEKELVFVTALRT
jgi:cytoplasmic iron level regulating protein YaaA (DUF328/UPF0246 family)